MIYGNTSGIKKTLLDRLEALVGGYEKQFVIDGGVLREICEISERINREICVYISRAGRLLSVGIGDSGTVSSQDVSMRRSGEKLTGVRCFHTHLNGSSALSGPDIAALHSARMDMIAAVNAAGGGADISMGFIRGGGETEIIKYRSFEKIDHAAVFEKIDESERLVARTASLKNVDETERAALVCVADNAADAAYYLEELKGLVKTAGLIAAGETRQIKSVPDKNFCVGRGMLETVRALVNEKKAGIIVFDNELSGLQLKNIEAETGVRTVDRAMLILEIFARHASTNEGKLQVELARLKYTLPKLLGQGKALSRIGGGGGSGAATKGAGETKLETDRRRVKRTIFELSEKIERIKKERDLRRENRTGSGIKTVAIVGYTNAGKSTLMNALAKSSVKAEDKLFATLDPVTRRIWVDLNKEYLLTDTVGFIDRLPHELIDAFRSTLEEAKYADLLLHVVDSSNESAARQYGVVLKVLESLGAGEKPIITVYNKVDALNLSKINDVDELKSLNIEGINKLKSQKFEGINALQSLNIDGINISQSLNVENVDSTEYVAISAKTGKGLDELREKINEKLFS
jgi:GTP-binding protein HflX